MARVRVRQDVRFIDIDQPGMVIVDALIGGSTDVQGAYVKVQPTIRASERSNLDDQSLRQDLIAAGAIAVVVAPIVVPDTKQPVAERTSARVMTPEQHIRKWFEGVSATRKVVERAVQEALTSVSEAGL